MSAGYSAQCRACNSAFRGDIDKRLLEGEPTRKISAWLHETHGERIPHNALANHKKAHLDVIAEVRARSVQAAAPSFEKAVTETLDTLATLDRLAAIGLRVIEAHAPMMADGGIGAFDSAQVALFNGCMKQTHAILVAKHELLDGKKVNIETSGAMSGPLIFVPPESDD